MKEQLNSSSQSYKDLNNRDEEVYIHGTNSSLGRTIPDFKEKNLEHTQMPVFENTHKGKEDIQNYAMIMIQQLRLNYLNDLTKQYVKQGIVLNFYDMINQSDSTTNKIFSGKHHLIKIPISPYDPEEMDERRADAITACWDDGIL